MGKVRMDEVVDKRQSDKDKDQIIADLTLQLNDMAMIIADMQLKQGGK